MRPVLLPGTIECRFPCLPFTGDIGFQNSPDAVTGSLGEGRFVLFFPGELHKPGVARPECTKVRKAVVKIRMEDKA